AAVGVFAVVRLWAEPFGKAGRALLLARLRRSRAGGLRISCHRAIQLQKRMRAKRDPALRVPLAKRKAPPNAAGLFFQLLCHCEEPEATKQSPAPGRRDRHSI